MWRVAPVQHQACGADRPDVLTDDRRLDRDSTGTPTDAARWWDTVGRVRYPAAQRLLVCADGGGSNGSRVRAWKVELAAFAADTALTVTVAHLPPGTRKWNKLA